MSLLRQLAQHLISHIHRRARRERCVELFFQLQELIIELVILVIAHDLLVVLLVRAARPVQKLHQSAHPLHPLCLFFIPLSLCHIYSPCLFRNHCFSAAAVFQEPLLFRRRCFSGTAVFLPPLFSITPSRTWALRANLLILHKARSAPHLSASCTVRPSGSPAGYS